MPTANSVTFQTDKDSLFTAAIQIIRDAGYVISETDDAAKKIIYYADWKKGAYERRFETTITVSGSLQAAILNVKAVFLLENAAEVGGVFGEMLSNMISNDKKFESDLINFVINELKKQYKVASETTIVNAPGAGGPKSEGGCLVLLGFLGLLAAGCGFGCFTFWATLFP